MEITHLDNNSSLFSRPQSTVDENEENCLAILLEFWLLWRKES